MVTVKPLIVHWHVENAPVYSVSFELTDSVNSSFPRFATAGGDSNIRIWRFNKLDPPQVEYLATLSKHSGAVNIVDFDPSGKYLASGSDDGTVLIWSRNTSNPNQPTSQFGQENDDLEKWSLIRKCRTASFGEIYDLAWSPCGRYLSAASIDKTVSILDTTDGVCIKALKDHKHYVQGVSWDPKNQFLVTQSSDQRVYVYPIKSEMTTQSKSNKTKNSTPTFESPIKIEKIDVIDNTAVQFYPESFSSFFRRLTFSTDGSLLVIPATIMEVSNKKSDCSIIFSRLDFKNPIAILPHPKPSLACVFNPRLFKLRNTDSKKLLDLDYRMIYAIATTNSIFIYDTEQTEPLGMASNLHYSSLTDLSWSPDGLSLLVTSIDGFVSLMQFKQEDLGEFDLSNEAEFLKNKIKTESILPEKTEPAPVNILNVRKRKKVVSNEVAAEKVVIKAETLDDMKDTGTVSHEKLTNDETPFVNDNIKSELNEQEQSTLTSVSQDSSINIKPQEQLSAETERETNLEVTTEPTTQLEGSSQLPVPQDFNSTYQEKPVTEEVNMATTEASIEPTQPTIMRSDVDVDTIEQKEFSQQQPASSGLLEPLKRNEQETIDMMDEP